jgi:prophage regulatory protein
MILIPAKESAKRMGFRKTTLYTRVQDGMLTRPVKVGPRLSAYPEHEISAINAATVAGKGPDEIRELVIELERQRAAA